MKKLLYFMAAFAFLLTSCSDDDTTPTKKNLALNISGLENLGADYAYEGWIIVNGSPVTTGVFTVNDNGELSNTSFELEATDLDNATAFVLTIEPSPDSDPSPSDVHILAGDFSGTTSNLTVDHGSAIGSNFSSSTGSYILATPTNGSNNNENSGVWWLDPNAGPIASLNLPTLPAGWKYEGWAVIDGTPVTTGKFTSVSGMDDNDQFSGTEAGPAFPGEDFLTNAPTGLTFPIDLAGMTVVISVEPEPDNSASPFLLKPLVGNVDAAATDHVSYDMTNNAANTNPTGTASR